MVNLLRPLILLTASLIIRVHAETINLGTETITTSTEITTTSTLIIPRTYTRHLTSTWDLPYTITTTGPISLGLTHVTVYVDVPSSTDSTTLSSSSSSSTSSTTSSGSSTSTISTSLITIAFDTTTTSTEVTTTSTLIIPRTYTRHLTSTWDLPYTTTTTGPISLGLTHVTVYVDVPVSSTSSYFSISSASSYFSSQKVSSHTYSTEVTDSFETGPTTPDPPSTTYSTPIQLSLFTTSSAIISSQSGSTPEVSTFTSLDLTSTEEAGSFVSIKSTPFATLESSSADSITLASTVSLLSVPTTSSYYQSSTEFPSTFQTQPISLLNPVSANITFSTLDPTSTLLTTTGHADPTNSNESTQIYNPAVKSETTPIDQCSFITSTETLTTTWETTSLLDQTTLSVQPLYTFGSTSYSATLASNDPRVPSVYEGDGTMLVTSFSAAFISIMLVLSTI